jgi:C4-dicarboxylate-specific signal transduction histidine kinase
MNQWRESPQNYRMPAPEPHSEALELRRCVRDLVALSALPAMWKGYEPGRIAESAASALVSMLGAEFVYLGLSSERDDDGVDVVKMASPVEATLLREIAAAVKLEIRDAGGRETMTIANPLFRSALRLAIAPIGFEGIGVIVAGALAADFPTETQRLLLITAANKAALGLHLRAEKKLESELRHLNETLENRVVQRTAELADAHKELLTEMSEHKRLESRLREAHLELGHAARLSSAGQIAAALAHELNQPLTAITNSLGATKRLLARGSPIENDLATKAMDEAVQQSLRAAQVVSRLRNFLIRGETETRCENVSAMVDDARSLALIGPTASGVEIRVLLDSEAPYIVANRIGIQQVLINLMRNALEAMAGMDPRKLWVTTTLRRQDLVEFAVADSGPGIGADMAERIFEPFVTTKRDGMGIGLSICRSIIETHGGRLQFEPNPDGGTIFHFTLPAVLRDRELDAGC